MSTGSNSLRRYACSVQPHLPAAAFCTQCRRPYAGRFLSVLRDGRAVCYRCLEDQGLQPVTTPRIGDGDPAFEKGWWGAIRGVVRAPVQTIGASRYKGSIRPALIFGFVMCLIGAVVPILWALVLSPEGVQETIESVYANRGMTVDPEQMRTMFITALPLAAAFKLIFGSVLLHYGIRFAGVHNVRFRESMRAFALSSGVLMLSVVPAPVGILLIAVLWARAMNRWVHVRYGLTPIRGMLALLPALVLMTIL